LHVDGAGTAIGFGEKRFIYFSYDSEKIHSPVIKESSILEREDHSLKIGKFARPLFGIRVDMSVYDQQVAVDP
jgi:hypothetical protein